MQVREAGLTIFGLIVTVTPLALWVAWSEFVFIFVLASSAGALIVICVLAAVGPSQEPERPHGPTQTLSNESLAELSDLGPFVYHHRQKGIGGPRFQASMRTLKSRLRIS